MFIFFAQENTQNCFITILNFKKICLNCNTQHIVLVLPSTIYNTVQSYTIIYKANPFMPFQAKPLNREIYARVCTHHHEVISSFTLNITHIFALVSCSNKSCVFFRCGRRARKEIGILTNHIYIFQILSSIREGVDAYKIPQEICKSLTMIGIAPRAQGVCII